MDPSPDPLFYSIPRFVTHIDDRCINALTGYYGSVLPKGARVLDLASSWISHLPTDFQGHVHGIGMNKAELAANKQLAAFEVRDLNESPTLVGLDDASFDACICSVSIDYLTQPRKVLAEVARVLKPGASVHCTFSNRCFPTKVISRWLRIDEDERCDMVAHAMAFAGSQDDTPTRLFSQIEVVTVLAPSREGDPLVSKQRELVFDGRLIVDLLLESGVGGVDALYPPDGPVGLRQLLKKLDENENAGTFLKRCIEYYLLLDYGDENRTTQFAVQAQLPLNPYLRSMIGYHLLDQGRLVEAAGHLAAVGEGLEYVSYIVLRLAADPQSLVSFVRLADPVITDPDVILEIVRAHTRQGSIKEAWCWLRKLPLDGSLAPSRIDGIRTVLGTAFAEDGASQPVPEALQILLSFPLPVTSEEEAVWAYCRDPPSTMSGRSRDLLVNWAVARLSAEGRHSDALALLRWPALAPSSGEAASHRQLLKRGLESVLAKVFTSVDTLLQAIDSAPAQPTMDVSVDLASAPWAPAQPDSPLPVPRSLLDAQANEAFRNRKPAPPAFLPPSATPTKRAVLPVSASPFRAPPTTSPAKRIAKIESRRTFSPSLAARRFEYALESYDGIDDASMNVGKHSNPSAVVGTVVAAAPSARSRSLTAKKPTQLPGDNATTPTEVPRHQPPEQYSPSRSSTFPGAFEVSTSVEDDVPSLPKGEDRLSDRQSSSKRKPKATRSRTAANLQSLADDDPPSVRTTRSKTMTGLSDLASLDEAEMEEISTSTPRRSKRLSVHPRTESPEATRTLRSPRKAKSRAK